MSSCSIIHFILISNFVYFVNCEIDCHAKDTEVLNEVLLKRTNYYRSLHGVDPLTLDHKLISGSTEWSQHLADIGELVHSKAEGYGENLFMGSDIKMDPIKEWYDEIKYYKGDYSTESGHFTQLVWKNHKEMGCGICTKDSKRTYVTCRYTPPGNVIGEFADNVLPPKGTPTPDGNATTPHPTHPPTIEERIRTIVEILVYATLVVTVFLIFIVFATLFI